MGADGYITIWRDDVVRKEFPDCDELFSRLPYHYRHELDGVIYHHCYQGDNVWDDWDDINDWIMPHYPYGKGELSQEQKDENNRMQAMLSIFVVFLRRHAATSWEVWT